MDRVQFRNFIESLPQNSVKRACFVVREYLKCLNIEMVNQNRVLSCKEDCFVTLEEYLEASKILLAYSYENSKNTSEVELCYCENDCLNIGEKPYFCPGEFSITSSSKARKLCKHYQDSSLI